MPVAVRNNAIADRTLFGTDQLSTVYWIVDQYLSLMEELDEAPPKNIDPMMRLHFDDIARRMRVRLLNPDDPDMYDRFAESLRGH